jgi:sec-independent protein translocase protein TatA
MGSLSPLHLLLLLAVGLLLFGGKGKISDIMGDVAKGIKSFKKGLSEDDTKSTTTATTTEPQRAIEHQKAAEKSTVAEQQKVG